MEIAIAEDNIGGVTRYLGALGTSYRKECCSLTAFMQVEEVSGSDTLSNNNPFKF
jgi:hypothetical protein